jgi:hypothetical protein
VLLSLVVLNGTVSFHPPCVRNLLVRRSQPFKKP